MQARASGSDLKLIFWFDHAQVGSLGLLEQPQTFQHEFLDQEGEHVFEIELVGKLPDHTKIADDGSIINDCVAEISDIALDDIELGHMFYEQARYHHDHNGSTALVETKFFGIMGCNGRVRLQFSSPVYLWLLEKM